MRIDLNTSLPAAADAGQSGRSAGGSNPAEARALDTTELSSDYGTVQALVSEVGQAPEIRQEKIASLSAMVRVGNYVVNAKQTAAALLSHMAEEPVA